MNPWHNVRLLNTIANTLLTFVALAVVVSAVWWVAHRPMFTLRAVAVEPARGQELAHVNDSLLRASGVRRIEGNFFTVDLQAVRASFEAVPWVRRATVRRVWPNRLQIGIEEHRVFAGWNDARFLNTFGEVFAVNPDEAEEDGPLPELAGPVGTEREVMRKFAELAEQLAPLQRRPVSLALSARYAWRAELDNGTALILGREQGLATRERIERFVRVYPELVARIGQWPGTIDLRYPNGFAIRLADAQAATAVARPGSGGTSSSATR